MKKLYNKYKILVLDGDHKNALSIVRHLGKLGFIIHVVSYSKASIAFFSRYSKKNITICNPKKDKNKFYSDLLDILKREKYDVLLPVSFISYQICSNHKKEISALTHLIIADADKIELASSKVATYKLAEELGVPYPKTIEINNINEVDEVDIAYPCVIKAPFELGKNIVDYASNKTDLVKKYNEICKRHSFETKLPIIQEYIDGGGFGYFAFYKEGKCKTYFMHKRIREYPVKGGASVCAESFYDEKLKMYGEKILDHLKWDGIAMVEFKQNSITGVYNLMEINAKFWGSLDLALVSGVNFPLLLISESLGLDILLDSSYKQKRFQWILNGELFHALERPRNIISIFIDLFRSKSDIWLRDLMPNLFQVIYIPIHYYKKWFK